MRLDATSAEIVSFLVNTGWQVYGPPIDCEASDESARVRLHGGRFAIVTRNGNGRLRAAVEVRDRRPLELLAAVNPDMALELFRAVRQLLLNTERTPFLAPSLDRLRAALEPLQEAERAAQNPGA